MTSSVLFQFQISAGEFAKTPSQLGLCDHWDAISDNWICP
eukprot:CAMPEP_0184356026 /NCGR_PEP_ID=MMETSP1089-20130417/100295_1 /TAXON_ID=38269 ORGANISM="Gloeochaete wittrockiana, Strain SAG46.84" /NCGR_SAMPLE_ID=MMETSP1089 /ASSEMBLY_ACC=CAM_ASM_000445 /LENGTH=39 /DNA_ID= /DNA_START= /DNA_END= /DNA_ORIENTATION=